MTRDTDDLTDDERRAYSALARGRPPREGIEDAIVARLRAQGQIASTRPARATQMLAAAASIVLAFAAGLALGRSGVATRQPPPPPRFVLLLYEGAAFSAPAPGHESERAAEYSAWARGVRGGRVVGGNELAERSHVVTAAGATTTETEHDLRGYFLLTADNERAAASIAETCPHLKYGGTIAIKAIIEH